MDAPKSLQPTHRAVQTKHWRQAILGLAVITSAALVGGCVSKEKIDNPAGDACNAGGDSQMICGVSKAEDMAPLANTKWVIVSGFAVDTLYRINRRTRAVENLVPKARSEWNRQAFSACPGPLAPGQLVAHGISIGPGADPYLYVINHGGREAVEVYGLDKEDAGLTWIGCVLIPHDMMANSVVSLRTGDLIVTSLGTPQSDVLGDIVAGRPTGNVRIWSAEGGWRILPRSEGSGPNGIAISPDERFIYVAMSGSRQVVRMAVDGSTESIRSGTMAILPDNLRQTERGTLLTTGMKYDPETNTSCFRNPQCQPPFDVYEIDPATMTVKSLSDIIDDSSLPLTTTALQVDDELWLSSINGEGIAVFPWAPPPGDQP